VKKRAWARWLVARNPAFHLLLVMYLRLRRFELTSYGSSLLCLAAMKWSPRWSSFFLGLISEFLFGFVLFIFEWSSLLILVSWYFSVFLLYFDDFSIARFLAVICWFWVNISIRNRFFSCFMLIGWLVCDFWLFFVDFE